MDSNFAINNNKSQLTDNFYVEFKGIPENNSNILGRQVITTTRPDLSFDISEDKLRGVTRRHPAMFEKEPINMTLYNDEDGVISTILNVMVMRQQNKVVDLLGSASDTKRDYRFDIEMKIYNSQKVVVETLLLTDCFISSVEYTDSNIQDNAKSTISVSIEFGSYDFKPAERFTDLVNKLLKQ